MTDRARADEFEGAGVANDPGIVGLPSASIMEGVRNVAGRTEAHVAEQSYRTVTGFVPGQVEVFDFLTTGDLDAELGFPAHSVIADNPTKLWLFVSAAQRFVPPGVLGYVMQIPRAASKAQARWRAPAGVANPAVGNATTATLTFCEAWLMPSAGFMPVAGGQ
jgi:hypothetical protein